MENQEETPFQYFGTTVTGERIPLLHTMAPIQNHSAVPMHLLYQDGSVDFVQDRLLHNLLDHLLMPREADCRLFLLLLFRRLNRKYQPLRILWAGGQPRAWSGMLQKTVQLFHPDSQIYHLLGTSAAVQGEGFIPLAMPWEHLLLPEKAFDILIVEDTESDGGVPVSCAGTLLASLRPWGEAYVSSSNPAWWQAVDAALGAGTDLRVGNGLRRVLYRLLTPQAQQTLTAPLHSLEDAWEEILIRVQACQEILSSDTQELDVASVRVVLQTAEQIEQGVNVLYPWLHSEPIKYLVNEWKRYLQEYLLGQGTWDEVRQSFALLWQDVRQEIHSE